MQSKESPKIHILTILAGIMLAAILIGLVFFLIFLSNQDKAPSTESEQVSDITIIPSPTETPTQPIKTEVVEVAETVQVVLPPGVIGIGAYVQVVGTEGSGLRMRAEAGTNTEVFFIAMDEEVFQVIGGPVEVGDYIWWQLEAPYDQTRTGWSAEPFLEVIEND